MNRGEVWLNVTYSTPDGGQIIAWVNALYLDVREANGDQQRLADLPTVPLNRSGEVVSTAITPPPIPENRVTARITNLDPGVNLNVRRTATTDGEVLARIPNDTATEFVGLGDSEEWVFIRYTPASGDAITGWAYTLYVEYEFRGNRIDLEEMNARGLLEYVDEATLRGEVGANAPTVAEPTQDTTRDRYIGTVTLDPGANLNLRRTPSVDGEVLAQIPSGSQIVLTGRTGNGEWIRTRFEGEVGWVSSQYLVIRFNGLIKSVDELRVIGGGGADTDTAGETGVDTGDLGEGLFDDDFDPFADEGGN